jgi:hypothetical protein
MFQIEQNIERTKNLYKKSQKNPGRFSKTSLLAMAFFALTTLVNADNVKLVTPEPQSMTTDGSTAVISTQEKMGDILTQKVCFPFAPSVTVEEMPINSAG